MAPAVGEGEAQGKQGESRNSLEDSVAYRHKTCAESIDHENSEIGQMDGASISHMPPRGARPEQENKLGGNHTMYASATYHARLLSSRQMLGSTRNRGVVKIFGSARQVSGNLHIACLLSFILLDPS